jgi:two-component system, NarL family, invasion response regulator UvrY
MDDRFYTRNGSIGSPALTLKILIVDDHAGVREGLRRLVSEAFDAAVFGEAASAEEALDRARSEPWDIVLLDISMPGRSGLDVLSEIREAQPDARVLIVSHFPESQFGEQSRRAGAAGYVAKDQAPENLVDAIKAVLAGGNASSLDEES